MILNHLDLYVHDVPATRDFLVRHFGFRHLRTQGAGALAILNDDAGLELVLSRPVAARGGADQVRLGVSTYHIGFRLPSMSEVDTVYADLLADGENVAPPRTMRGRYLFYCEAPGGVVVEVAALTLRPS